MEKTYYYSSITNSFQPPNPVQPQKNLFRINLDSSIYNDKLWAKSVFNFM